MLTIQANGNIVIEPKLVNLKDFKIVESRIAVTKTKDKTIFIDVKFKNNKAGEIFLQHAKKGSSVSVWGQVDEETWGGEGKDKKSKLVIEADGFRFSGSGKSEDKPRSGETNGGKKTEAPVEEDSVPF